MATNTTFFDFVTPVPADWLNNVNNTVNYTAPFTGATLRPLVQKAAESISVKDFGAIGNGSANDTVPVQNALAYMALIGGGALYFPAGTYILNSQFTFAFTAPVGSITIHGDGQDATILKFPNVSAGFVFDLISQTNSVHVRDMTMTTSQMGLSTGITINQIGVLGGGAPLVGAQNEINSVLFYGSSGLGNPTGPYWGTAISATSASNINFINVNIYGPELVPSATVGGGITIQGTLAAPPVIFNFFGCNFTWLGYGINYGSYVQGITVTGSNFVSTISGVVANAGLDNTLSELSITNSQFASGLYAVQLGTAVVPFNFANNVVEIYPSSVGLSLNPAGLLTIIGNTFLGLNTKVNNAGIHWLTQPAIIGDVAKGVITGNMFYNLTTGILLEAGVSYANIQSNSYSFCTNNYLNNGSNNTIGGGSA